MRSQGSSAELAHRRELAIHRLLDGYAVEEVADFLEVDASTVRRWRAGFVRDGWAGLRARPVPGRPTKLTRTQEKIVLRWLDDPPTAFGFTTELWTAARLADLIRQEWGVDLSPRYLPRWLRRRGFSPQKPERVPHERNDEGIAAWLRDDWPRIKKTRRPAGPASFSSTKVGS
jgi:transposase